jgi:predicted AlkP superfamily pyrophosphatase or phosphodiesterase
MSKHFLVASLIFVIQLNFSGCKSAVSGGAHGYDPYDPEMKAFFLASGPSFKAGITIPPFELVYIYELMCNVLGLSPASNDGDPAVLRPILN